MLNPLDHVPPLDLRVGGRFGRRWHTGRTRLEAGDTPSPVEDRRSLTERNLPAEIHVERQGRVGVAQVVSDLLRAHPRLTQPRRHRVPGYVTVDPVVAEHRSQML